MNLPAWDDRSSKYGTKIRVGLWLLSVVGTGNTFTKAQLREAFPGVEQVDRRMRDLRQHGWKIDTNKEDASLTLNELRLVRAGEEIWKPGKSSAGSVISNKERMAVMAADNFMCVVCGIGGGESYADSDYETAQLSVSRRPVHLPDGGVVDRFVTVCKRCKAGASDAVIPTLPEVLDGIEALDLRDRQALNSWIKAGRRLPGGAERVWGQYRRLAAGSRLEVEERLRSRP
jgi:hypothetical protein